MLSLSGGLRREGLPSLTLVELLLKRSVKLVVHEDNTATIQCIKSGYSPALRHMARTARASLGFLNEVFFGETEGEDGEIISSDLIKPVLQHCPTLKMKADIFTKSLDRAKFEQALQLLGVSKENIALCCLAKFGQQADEQCTPGTAISFT